MKLNESQLRKIIKESVKKVLNETSSDLAFKAAAERNKMGMVAKKDNDTKQMYANIDKRNIDLGFALRKCANEIIKNYPNLIIKEGSREIGNIERTADIVIEDKNNKLFKILIGMYVSDDFYAVCQIDKMHGFGKLKFYDEELMKHEVPELYQFLQDFKSKLDTTFNGYFH